MVIAFLSASYSTTPIKVTYASKLEIMTDQEGRSPGSTVAVSEMMDEAHLPTAPSSPVRALDPRTSLQHVLAESRHNTPASASRNNDMTEDEGTRTPSGAPSKAPSKRSKANNQNMNPSIYVGNKVKHLKKEDSEPLWRKDIQYDFLKAVFEDDKAVFTNSYESEGFPKQTFASLYIDTMARSSKTSKILRDKLLTDHEPAKNMAMVCLLVNLGRMNTTLNCRCECSIDLLENLTALQSSPRCERNYEHITRFPPYRHIKIPIHTNNFKMLPD